MANDYTLEDFQRLYQQISNASSQSQQQYYGQPQEIPAGFRQATKYEKGLGDILKLGQTLSDLTGWNQRYQEMKEQRLAANPNEKWYTTLAHGIASDPLGFIGNLPGQTISAPMFGVNEALEAITGTPYTEAYDGLLPDAKLDAGQRAASAGNAAIDFIGPFIGGSGTMLKGVAGLAKGVSAAETMAAQTARAAKSASKLGKVGNAIRKGAAWEPKSFAGKMAWDIGEEGGEEFIQSIFEDKRGDYTGHTDWGQGFDLDKALEQGTMGAIGGGIMGGAIRGPRAVAEYVSKKSKEASKKVADKEIYTDSSFVQFLKSDEPWISSYLEDEERTADNQRAALNANKAASLTLVADSTMNASSISAVNQVAAQKQGQEAKSELAPGQVVGKAPLTQHQCRVSVDEILKCLMAGVKGDGNDTVETNGTAKTLHLTQEEFNAIIANSSDTAKVMQIINTVLADPKRGFAEIIVEKSPAFNEGPVLLQLVEVIPDSNKIQVASQTLPKLNADLDQDGAVAFFDYGLVHERISQGVGLFGIDYKSWNWTDWTAVNRASFVPSGIVSKFAEYRQKKNKKGEVEREAKPLPSYSEFKKQFADSGSPEYAWFIMLDETIDSINNYVKKETSSNENILNKDQVLNDIFNIEFREKDHNGKSLQKVFDKTFGIALDNIRKRVEEKAREMYKNVPVGENQNPEYAPYKLQADVMNYVIAQFNAEAQRNIIVQDLVSGTDSTIAEIGMDAVEKIITDPDPVRIQPVLDGVHYSNLTELLVMLRYFSPYFDPQMKKNPIFRSSGAVVMSFQGMPGIKIGEQNSFRIFVDDLFAAVELASLRQEEYGEQARTVAKARLAAEVRAASGFTKGFLRSKTLAETKSDFISSWNDVRNRFKEIVDARIDQNGSVQQSMQAAIPQIATDDNWMFLFAQTYGDSSLSDIFGDSEKDTTSAFGNMSMNGLFRRANYNPGFFDMNIITEYAVSLPDDVTDRAKEILISMGNAYRTKNVRLGESLNKILESKETGDLFSRLRDEIQAYDNAKLLPENRRHVEQDRLLGLIRKELDAMHALFGRDFLKAYGWMSSSQMVRSATFRNFVNNPGSRANILFNGMVLSREIGLFGVKDEKTGYHVKGLLEEFWDQKEEIDRRKHFGSIISYFNRVGTISDLYGDFAAFANIAASNVDQELWTMDQAVNEITKRMKFFVSESVSLKEKEQVLGVRDNTDANKMNRSILIESMASSSSTVDEIGLSQKVSRAKQLGAANTFEMLNKRREAIKAFAAAVDNEESGRMFIEDTLRNCSIDVSTASLAAFYYDAGRVTRPQMEKVNVTKGQSWLYGAASFTSAIRSKTVFQQITDANSPMNIELSSIFNDPRIMADLFLHPSKEIGVYDNGTVNNGGFMVGTITGAQLWSAATGGSYTVDFKPKFSDWINLLETRPELVDLICPMFLRAGLAGDLATVTVTVDENHNADTYEKIWREYEKYNGAGNQIAIKRAEQEFLTVLLNDNPNFVAKVIPSFIKAQHGANVWQIKGKLDDFLQSLADAAILSAINEEYDLSSTSQHNGLARVWNTALAQTYKMQWDPITDTAAFDALVTDYLNTFEELINNMEESMKSVLGNSLNMLVGLSDAFSINEDGKFKVAISDESKESIHSMMNKTLGPLKEILAKLKPENRVGKVKDTVSKIGKIVDSLISLDYMASILRGQDNSSYFEKILPGTSDVAVADINKAILDQIEDVVGLTRDKQTGEVKDANIPAGKRRTGIKFIIDDLATNETDPKLVNAIVGQAIGNIRFITANEKEAFKEKIFALRNSWAERDKNREPGEPPISDRQKHVDVVTELIPYSLRERALLANISIYTDAARDQREIFEAFQELSVSVKEAKTQGRLHIDGINTAEYANRKITEPFESGFDVFGVDTATMRKRCMDLLVGSNVAMDTGNEGNQYKAAFGVSILPHWFVPGEWNTKTSCSVRPQVDSDWSKIPVDEIKAGHIFVYQTDKDGNESQVNALRIAEADRQGEVKWVNQNKCTCGFCGTHNGQGTELGIAKSASIMSENLTIKARKILKTAIDTTIKSYTGKTVQHDPIIFNATQENMPTDLDQVIYLILRNHDSILDTFADNIKTSIQTIEKEAEDETGLLGHERQYASLCNSFVELTVVTNGVTENKIFTIDELYSGVAKTELANATIVKAKQQFLTLDQVGKRILQQVAFKRQEARKKQGTPWSEDDTQKREIAAVQIQAWAIEALTKASDLRGDRNAAIAKAISQGIAKRGPLPNRGDVMTDVNITAVPSSQMRGVLFESMGRSNPDFEYVENAYTFTPQRYHTLVTGTSEIGGITNVSSILYASEPTAAKMNVGQNPTIFRDWRTRDQESYNPGNIQQAIQRHNVINSDIIPQVPTSGNTVVVVNSPTIDRYNLMSVIKASSPGTKFYFVFPQMEAFEGFSALIHSGFNFNSNEVNEYNGYSWIEIDASALKDRCKQMKWIPPRYNLTQFHARDHKYGLVQWAYVSDEYFRNKSDSTGEIMDAYKKDVGVVYNRPFNVALPDFVNNNWKVAPKADFDALMSDEEKKRFAKECIDSFLVYSKDAAKKKSIQDNRYLHEKGILDYIENITKHPDRINKIGEYCPMAIIKFTDLSDGTNRYYPLIERPAQVGPNMAVAGVLEAPTTGEVTIVPVTALESLDEQTSLKLYAASAAYKMMTAYGPSGNATFDTGNGKVALFGSLYQDALKSRLVGHINDSMTSMVYWHQYQEWMFRNGFTLKLGDKLKSIMPPTMVTTYSQGLDMLNKFDNIYGYQYDAILEKIATAGINFRKNGKESKDRYHEQLKLVLARLFTNCSNLGISPAFLFNIDADANSNSGASYKRCTSRDAAIFDGLTVGDIQLLFNWMTSDFTTGNGKFCPDNNTRVDDKTGKDYYIWGEGMMNISWTVPDTGKTVDIISRVLIPEYLSSGFSTERAAFTTRIHKNMPQDVTLALKHGIDNLDKSTLDRCLDWATSETLGIYDDYMNSYLDKFFQANDPDEKGYDDLKKMRERRLINDFEYRNQTNWYNQQINENKFDNDPVELYTDDPTKPMSKEDADAIRRQCAEYFNLGRSKHRLNLSTLDAIYNACLGRAASNNFNNVYAVNANHYIEVMQIAANRLNRGENPFALSKAELNRVARTGKDGKGVKTRFSIGIAPLWAIKDVVVSTDWCEGNLDQAKKVCLDYAETMRQQFGQTTNVNGIDALKQARALENRISFLMYQNGVDLSKLRIYGFADTVDIDSASENVLNIVFQGTERDIAKEREKQQYTRQGYEQLARRQGERYKKLYDSSDGIDHAAVSTLTFQGSVDQTLKTGATIARCNSLLTLELPMNAFVDKGLNYSLMLWATRNADNGLLGPFARTARNRVKVSDGTIKSVAYDSSVNTIISIAREAAASGRIADFMQFVEQNQDNLTMDSWLEYMNQLNKGSKFDQFIDNAYRKIAKISTAEGFLNQFRNEIWLRRFLEIVGSSDYHADLSQVLPNGRTRIEENLMANPAKTIANLFGPNSMHAEEAFRALNSALKGDMAQDNLVSSLFTYVTKNGSTMDFLMATLGFKFLRASVNFSMRVANNIAPVSTINYFLVKLFESGVMEKIPGIGARLKGFQNEAHRLQIYNDFREALAVDMAHMSMTAVAAVLAMTLGGIEPPEDEDKWPNEGEWTICGFRLSMNWWLKDVLGLTIPLAITWKSALLGKPQLFTLFDSLGDAVMSNPWIKVGDIVSAIIDPDEATNELAAQIEAYSNYPGGPPDGMEYIMGSAGAFGLSYLGQFITPGFVKELTRVLPKWEHSSNKIYAEDLTGRDADPTSRTKLTTFEDAQIRKVTKGNVFLGLLADMFNDSSTGYTVWEMPRQTVADPNQIAFMQHYSIYNLDGTPKSKDEMSATCLELVYLLQAYGDASKLRSAGFYLDYDTRAAVSKLLSDFKTYVKAYYQQVSIDTNDLDPAVLGVGSIITGQQNGKEIVSSYNALIAQIEALHDLLWDDELTKGLTYYNRYNTTWDEDLYGNIYATGYRDNLAGLLMPFKVAPTTSTAGWDEDWATNSAVTGEAMYDRNGNGLRALIPANIDDWGKKDDDGNVTYSDLYKLLWGNNGYGNGSGGRSYGRSGGGSRYPSTPNIYAPNTPSTRTTVPEATLRFNKPITNVGLNDYFIRPGFETKGSRKAYRREDI